jgi:hypothetical protein
VQADLEAAQITWSKDNTFYVAGSDASANRFKVKATLDGAKIIAQFPQEITDEWARQDSSHSVQSGQFSLSVTEDRGSFQLLMGRGQKIASGSRELLSYLVDLDRSLVFYPKAGITGAIVTFDLKTRKSWQIDLPFAINIELEDRTKDGTVAFTTQGQCAPDQSTEGYENERVQPDPILRRRVKMDNSRHLCLLKLPISPPAATRK